VHGRAATVIPRPDIYSFLFEVVKCDRLVALSRNVHHINPVVILRRDVRAVLQEKVTEECVALETGKMKCCESIGSCLDIDPV